MVPRTRRAAYLLGLGSGVVDWGCRTIHDNLITEIPAGWLDEATSLEELYMNSNLITEIPESWLDQATSLQKLWMHNNLITEIPESWLDQATKLTIL